ncbi:MAG: UMP kinase [Candidatus Buchananbacteria bacterium RIFCSPLOWO2_01_FULL_40_23b]|uniref:Uridylate kinase n=1 Tax=Candidatus Buchananbacteria bacterium RIFCSPLOWO2_01_FULL_40_23b TaxID=1797544 RepID=A0A1G1YVT2_9BACT|nr:MAG: UMP kinase [Candidatus Buchananbacteria bacterium RIFCSPLOWO2_01_FULL_40_23b]
MKYKRVLLKITGELLGDNEGKGLNFEKIDTLAEQILSIRKKTGVQFAIVVGAGNLFRGRQAHGTTVDRVSADYIGMLGTVMNALALREALERLSGKDIRVMTPLMIESVAEPFIQRRALYHLKRTGIIIFAGGIGNPFFTTDSAAALRACELSCDVILKGSNVDGVYSKDPHKYKNARRYSTLRYQEALEKGLNVMDSTAFALCQSEKIPIIVFNIQEFNLINKILNGERIGTLITA